MNWAGQMSQSFHVDIDKPEPSPSKKQKSQIQPRLSS